MFKFVSFLAFLMFSINSFGQTISHPTEINISPEFGISHTIDSNTSNIENSALEKLAERITNYSLLHKIGKKEGLSHEMLGKVMDAHIDEKNSKLYILDTQNIGVLTYDLEGNFLEKVTREGKGPGELVNPFSVKTNNNKTYILDRRFDIKVFANNGDKMIHDGTINTPFRPESFCFNDAKIFVNVMPVTDPTSIKNKSNIYSFYKGKYTEPVDKFGILYKSNNWFAIMHMSLGGIECASNSSAVIQYYDYLNLIYAFVDGELSWITKLDDFNFLEILEKPDGSLGPDRNNLPINFDSIAKVLSINDRYFIVQVVNRTISEDGYSTNGISTYLINYDDGNGTLISNKLPMILSISDKKIAFLKEDEYPKILLAQY